MDLDGRQVELHGVTWVHGRESWFKHMWFLVWGTLLLELRFATFQTAKQLLWWEILLAPPPNCFNAIPNLLEIPEAWIFVEISVDPQNYRSFPHIFLGREMLTWRCKMPTRSNRCLGMWSQNLFDFIHMFLSKNAAHCRSQGLLMAPRIW